MFIGALCSRYEDRIVVSTFRVTTYVPPESNNFTRVDTRKVVSYFPVETRVFSSNFGAKVRILQLILDPTGSEYTTLLGGKYIGVMCE